MAYPISKRRMQQIISATHFANEGDVIERAQWTLIKERFPNCEVFWKIFVVLSTRRIETEPVDINERIRHRDGVSADIKGIAAFHYSMFVNLTYAYNHLINFREPSFSDFYAHVGIVCDMAEEFLLKLHLFINECKGRESETLQKLSKQEFLKLADKWYDKRYGDIFDNYLKKGKSLPIWIPSRNNVLDEYFGDLGPWTEYKKFSQLIRTYRNIIMHDVHIGQLEVNGEVLVPKKEKIANYKKWDQIFAVASDTAKQEQDFINMREQMLLDIGTLEIHLNALWEKAISDIRQLLDQANRTFLTKFDLDLQPEGTE